MSENEEQPQEKSLRFPLFASEVGLLLGNGPDPDSTLQGSESFLRDFQDRLTRFDRDSELMRFNQSPEEVQTVSPLLYRAVSLALQAAEDSGGLLDPTVLASLEREGYQRSWQDREPLSFKELLSLAPRSPLAKPSEEKLYQKIELLDESQIRKPVGLGLDLGGIGKGLALDILAEKLTGFSSWSIDLGGDLRFGGQAELPRQVIIPSPFGDTRSFTFPEKAVATSGLWRRAWTEAGIPKNHIIDPGRGTSYWGPYLQVTAFAQNGTEAERLAKTVLLGGEKYLHLLRENGGLLLAWDGQWREIG